MVQPHAKTELGQEVIKKRSVALSPRQRTLLLLCDGKRDDEQLMRDTAGLGVTPQDLQALLELGLVCLSPDSVAPDRPRSVDDAIDDAGAEGQGLDLDLGDGQEDAALSAPERYLRAYPIAARLTAKLGFRGVLLQQQVERCSTVDELRQLFPKLKEAADRNAKAMPEIDPLREALGLMGER